MPPKKALLFCLVHGDPESSAFGIKYDKIMTVDELKDVIKNRLYPLLDDVSVKDLTLYKVDINTTTQSPQRTTLNNPNYNIVNDLGGQMLSPMDTMEEKFPAPTKKHIHVIVDVSAVDTRRNDNKFITRLDKIDKNIEEIKRKKPSVQISAVTERNWMKIQYHTGLDYQSTSFEIEFPNLYLDLGYESIETFRWTDAIENSQKERYKFYLTNILKLGRFLRLGLYDSTGDGSFLSTNTDFLPINLSGTADLVIVDRHSITSQAQEKHIRVLFKVKKAIIKKHTFQIMAELISADLKSTYTVLAVLTNLVDDWRFFWIKGKIIMRITLSMDQSVALLRQNLTLAEDKLNKLTNQRSPQMGIESSSSEVEELIPKRQKLGHVLQLLT
ncbi:6463_t:CDS:2 [Acaulospora morrowiae]|uniref:6463_t:CDS:1 n=1 Tax=Acaulospora morrowiae TaxID=94023 RepID=A0A9N8V695_9GLOM|nr:6463_t:CDS:2 [Acaulospora morrowiae]